MWIERKDEKQGRDSECSKKLRREDRKKEGIGARKYR